MIACLSVHKKHIHFIGILQVLIKSQCTSNPFHATKQLLNYRHSFRFKNLLFLSCSEWFKVIVSPSSRKKPENVGISCSNTVLRGAVVLRTIIIMVAINNNAYSWMFSCEGWWNNSWYFPVHHSIIVFWIMGIPPLISMSFGSGSHSVLLFRTDLKASLRRDCF